MMKSKQFTFQEPVPVGPYPAKFVRAEETDGDKYGPGVAFIFEITHGPYAGRQVSRVTAPEPTPKNSCGKMLKGLGVVLSKDADMRTERFVGSPYTVILEETQEGGTTRVGNVLPPYNTAPTPSVAPAAAPAAPMPAAAPPRRPPVVPPAPKAPVEPRYYVLDKATGLASLKTTDEVQQLVDAAGDLAAVQLMAADEHENAIGESWANANTLGFTLTKDIPF
jgi:hypothetical protein